MISLPRLVGQDLGALDTFFAHGTWPPAVPTGWWERSGMGPVGTWRDILSKKSAPIFLERKIIPLRPRGWAISKGLGILASCIAVWTMISYQQLEWDDFGEIANPKSPIKKSFWSNKTCHGHEGTNSCHSVSARSLREAPLVHSCSCLRKIAPFGEALLGCYPFAACLDHSLIFILPQISIHSIRKWIWVSSLKGGRSRGMNFYTTTIPIKQFKEFTSKTSINVLPNWSLNIFQSAAAHESCHQTSSPRLLPLLPWLEVSSL